MNRLRPLRWVAVAVVALLVLARIVLHYGAEITIKSAFYDALGMGGAYDRRWHTSVLLALTGVLIALAVALVPVFVSRAARGGADLRAVPSGPTGPLTEAEIDRIKGRLDRDEIFDPEEVAAPSATPRAKWMRNVGWAGFGIAAVLVMASIVPSLVGARDDLLAARDAVSFGQVDPVFGRDVSFFVFVEPALRQLVGLVLSVAFLVGLVSVATGGAIVYAERQRGAMASANAVLERTTSVVYAAAGVLALGIAATLWLSRYELTVADGDVVAGAGAATRAIDIPTRAVGAVLIAVLGLGLIALAAPRLRRRITELPAGTAAKIAVVIWAVTVVLLVVLASPWWLILGVPVAIAAVVLWRMRPTVWQVRRTPFWAPAALVAASTIVAAAIGPIGAALNDAIVLRGSQLQVERENIEATLSSTRIASGIDKAQARTADYRRNGVTRKAIAAAPASTGSLRFLDIPPTLEACLRLQTFNQFYRCGDVDVDRYPLEGARRTVFSIGREINYPIATGFQRQHFSFTHGYGLILAPVNEIEPDTGRPRWIAGDIPQRGLDLQRPEIYFGAQDAMPWSMVNTSQRVFNGQTNVDNLRWEGTTGIRVGSGWRRLAMTEYLGGLPFVGGGRRVWNATSGRPADADSQLLLFRDIRARVAEIAPFLAPDGDPWFVADKGRLWVMENTYVATGRYPYAARFNGANYVRTAAVAVMDAYSGDTKLYVPDANEPMTKTWRSVYPEVFSDIDQMPAGLRKHMRFGEGLFDFQAEAIGRYHVSDPETFFNGDEAWASTQEAYGPGVQGTQQLSAARYTYAVLPGDATERFLLIRSFKPATPGRGIGFSGWLAASNEPEDFGRLTLVNFPANETQALDSLDTFTSNVVKDPQLSEEIGQRRDSVLRGNTIVVPIGEGLLYVQPLYLDSSNDSLPTLWQVIVSFGNGRVFAAASFSQALEAALGASGQGGGDGADPPRDSTLAQLVEQSSREFDAYRKAFGEGDYPEAARRLNRFQRALEAARQLAARGSGTPTTPAAPATPPTPTTSTPANP